MSIEDEIFELLKQGLKPKEVIERGYKKSTVYKVYQKFKFVLCDLPTSLKIEDIKITSTTDKDRFLPGEIVTISGYFRNTSDKDFYLYRIGIQPEWLREKWIVQEVREIIRPRERKYILFRIKIPEDLPLGEYELRFGVEGQYLMSNEPPKFSWADPPIVLQVKHPIQLKVFISHSTRDLSLIRLLEKNLDNYGIQAIIAEDLQEPGVDLWQKITKKIDESDALLAILTENAVRSEWVMKELEYANKIKKHIIPLKEKTVNIHMSIEWVEFSRDDSPEVILSKVVEAFSNIKSRSNKIDSNIVNIIGSLILGFIFGLLVKFD